MDEFVVLTERYGLKPRGKSAPMAVLKRSVNPNNGGFWYFGSGDNVNSELTSNHSKFEFGNSGYLFTVMPESISSSVNAVDDLLDDFTGLFPAAKSLNQNSSGDLGKNEDGFDELIPGFGASVKPSNSKYQETEAVEVKKQQFGIRDLDSLFIPGPRSSSVPNSWGSPSAKKPAAPAQFLDDFSPLFEADLSRGEFEEFPGESDKRRMARWEREQRIKNQVAKAISDTNSRDHQIQIEQEQRSRISETLDAEIKLWAAGKEGNMLVLWPGCGWEAVSLTDLITSAAVKKVYKKANLYVHPDKVQQKGAQQKYIA